MLHHSRLFSSRRLSETQALAEADSLVGALLPVNWARAPAAAIAMPACLAANSAWVIDGCTARLANTNPSRSELEASRLAPCRPVHATSPHAYSPACEQTQPE